MRSSLPGMVRMSLSAVTMIGSLYEPLVIRIPMMSSASRFW